MFDSHDGFYVAADLEGKEEKDETQGACVCVRGRSSSGLCGRGASSPSEKHTPSGVLHVALGDICVLSSWLLYEYRCRRGFSVVWSLCMSCSSGCSIDVSVPWSVPAHAF